jgi:carotenoid cleavage dioxygenase-like enzyme
MSHDMAITRHFSILMDFPLWSFTGPTKVEDRSRFGLIPRHAESAQEVRWFEGTGLYGYHTANSFEQPGTHTVELIMIAAVGFSFQRRCLPLFFLPLFHDCNLCIFWPKSCFHLFRSNYIV